MFGVRKFACFAGEIQFGFHYVLLQFVFIHNTFVGSVFMLGDAVLFCLTIVPGVGDNRHHAGLTRRHSVFLQSSLNHTADYQADYK